MQIRFKTFLLSPPHNVYLWPPTLLPLESRLDGVLAFYPTKLLLANTFRHESSQTPH